MIKRAYTTATGQFRIEPPLTWAEFKDSPYRPEHAMSEPDVLLEVETNEIDGPDGAMLLHRAIAVRPYSPGRPFAYHGDLTATLQALLDEHGTAHRFSGFFECRDVVDDMPGDPFRLIARNGRAARVEPVITWPGDGE